MPIIWSAKIQDFFKASVGEIGLIYHRNCEILSTSNSVNGLFALGVSVAKLFHIVVKNNLPLIGIVVYFLQSLKC